MKMIHRQAKKKAQRKSVAVNRATYTVDELAKLLGRNRITIYADLAAGRIPSRRLGKRYLISRAAIQRWLESTAA